MESRFAHLRQRDTSVSMLRVKLSRRRSQSQKENRERAVNTRRQLDQLPELEISSLNASIATVNISTISERKQSNAKSAITVAQEERLKRLERWKEQKALEKEKEKRMRELKGVFKTGLFQPKDTLAFLPLPDVPPASFRDKEKKVNVAPCQSTRVTRSMKQQQEPQKPLAMQHPNTAANRAQSAAETLTRTRAAPVKPPPAAAKSKAGAGRPAIPNPAPALSTRSANRTLVTKAPAVKGDLKSKAADVRTTRSTAIVKPLPPSSGEVENCKALSITTNTAASRESEEHQIQEPGKNVPPEVEDMMVDQPPEDSAAADAVCSFAPEGFVFQAPVGLLSFKFEPMTPRSADAFLTPSSSFNLPAAPGLSVDPELSGPTSPETPGRSRPRSPHTIAPKTPAESKHDVPYFRSEIATERERLTSLCLCWESKVEDESIPEEMRDGMRTAVGQARLLMKERFKQFSGLVDDCELRRGEKITTCTDLQGFWDMVYFQVEDVNKKFDALKEAEGRGWVEEHKPPPRQRKVVKKPVAAPAKPAANKAAARSRLAAVKAAMKAKRQADEAERAAASTENPQEQQPETEGQIQQHVLSDGGFKVESPAKPSVRRSSRLSAAVLPQASPCSLLSPRRVTRRSVALAQTPVGAHPSPARPVCSPEPLHLFLKKTPAPKSQRSTPRASHSRKETANTSLCFSPVKGVFSEVVQPEQSSTQQSEPVSMQEEVSSAPELSTSIQILPSAVEKEENKPADLPLSPRLSLSLCKTPPPVLQAPEPPSALSFTLTPCVTPVQLPIQTQQSACPTPDSYTSEELPGLDFERYLQPSHKCSSASVDVVMESPRDEPEELLMQQEPAGSSVPMLPSPQIQTAESDLLLFTPDLRDRIRPSVCPSDLMVFTPPSNI